MLQWWELRVNPPRSRPLLPLAPNGADPDVLSEWIAVLLDQVAHLTGVTPPPIRVEIAAHTEFVAITRPSRSGSSITLSPNSLRIDIVTHELAHCLIPSSSLFLAEGFAGWVGCTLSGTCEHLWFAQTRLDDVLRQHWSGTPAVDELLSELVGEGIYLAPERFATFHGRLAHAIAASFCGHWHLRFPVLARSIAAAPAADACDLLASATGRSVGDLICAWQAAL